MTNPIQTLLLIFAFGATPVMGTLASGYQWFGKSSDALISGLLLVVLNGIYLLSLIGIAGKITKIPENENAFKGFLLTLIGFHSAAFIFLSYRMFGLNVFGDFYTGLGGLSLTSPVLHPPSFGAFLCLSFYLFGRKQLKLAAVAAGVAVILNRFYLLPACLMMAAYVIYLFRRPADRFNVLVAIFLFAAVLFPVLRDLAADPGLLIFSVEAQAVDVRPWLLTRGTLLKMILIGLAVTMLPRHRRFSYVMTVLFSIVLFFSLIQLPLQSHTLGALAPWSVSVVLVPVSFAFLSAKFWLYLYRPRTHQPFKRKSFFAPLVNGLIPAIFLLVIAASWGKNIYTILLN